jgi:putative transposase
VQVRYRYRAYPTQGQQQTLARTFGCARVVFNDALRLRDELHALGERLSGIYSLALLPPPSRRRSASG